MYDYDHLEQIEVRRDDQKLYTFKEGDFKRLRLQDIEDMLLLLIQQKLTNLTIDERYNLNVALLQEEEIDAFEMNSTSYGSGYRQAALSEEVDAESRNVRWWKDIRERSQAFGKDNMTLSYFISTHFSIGVIDEILEEDFDALLDEGSEILHFIEGTILEEKLFAEFNEFMAMTVDENSESESDTKEPPFEKITFNTD
ncbi:hypothetical protein Tco_0415297 [Tanacetum coccineum]